MNRPEDLGTTHVVAARNGRRVEVGTDRFAEPQGSIFAETVIYTTDPAIGVQKVRRVLSWRSTVEAVDGHRGIVRRARRSRRRKRPPLTEDNLIDVINDIFTTMPTGPVDECF